MFSLGCCGNVLKQIVDISNIPIDLSTDLSNSLIFERDIELMIPLLDVSSQQIHVIDAMNVFLNENKELLEEKVGVVQEVAQEKLDIIKENVESIQENVESIQENVESIQENVESIQENVESIQENVESIQEVVRERSNTVII